MNLFRSEEHVRNWALFAPGTEAGIVPLANIAKLFSHQVFRRRLDPDYFSRRLNYRADLLAALKEMDPYWHPAGV
jgi:hypothetical protein